MDKALVTILGLAGIGAIYWYFFGKKDVPTETKSDWEILVEGGYRPAVITVPAGRTSRITFVRKDPSSCLEEIVIPEFKIRKFLPINERVTITVSPTKHGSFAMHCGMNMFHGKIVVR